MNISNLINKILTPLLYFTAIQENNGVSAETATIGEKSWDFPPHSSLTMQQVSGVPYNATLTPYSYLGYETGCKSFIDKSTTNTITPGFSFHYPENTGPIWISDCKPNIQLGQITTECPKLSFRHTNNVEVMIRNDHDVHVVGVDCDSGL